MKYIVTIDMDEGGSISEDELQDLMTQIGYYGKGIKGITIDSGESQELYIAVCGEELTADKDFDHFVSNIREVYDIPVSPTIIKATIEENFDAGDPYSEWKTVADESVRVYKITI